MPCFALSLGTKETFFKRHLLKYNFFDYDKNSGIYGLPHFGENKFILSFLVPGRVRQQLFYLFLKMCVVLCYKPMLQRVTAMPSVIL